MKHIQFKGTVKQANNYMNLIIRITTLTCCDFLHCK